MAHTRPPGKTSRPAYTPLWEPDRNAVHRLVQIIDVLAIAFNRFRQLSFKLPQPGSADYTPHRFTAEQERLWDAFSEVKRAVFPVADVAPQYTAASLSDA